MKLLMVFLLIGTTLVSMLLAQSSGNVDLKEYQWKNRLILIFAPSYRDSSFQELEKQIKQLKFELLERDIVLFYLFENGDSFVGDSLLGRESVNYLQKKYNIASQEFALLLIGKDGGEKLRKQKNINFKSIFNLIDAMPMRRMEINQRSKE